MELLNKNQISERMKVTEQLCPKHGGPLCCFKKFDGEYTAPFCTECTEEKIADQERQNVEATLGHDANFGTYEVFKRESTVTNELTGATFANFKAETPKEIEAKEFAINQVRQYLNGMRGNTVITGPTGAGKSHLTYSMARAINEGYKDKGEPKRVLFVSIAEIVTRIQAGWQYKQSNFTEDDAVKLLTSVDYLFIDDLGTESIMSSQKREAGNWVQGFLFKVLDKRDTTIINTNHSGKELAAMYNEKLVSRIGKQSEGSTFNMQGIADKRMRRNFLGSG